MFPAVQPVLPMPQASIKLAAAPPAPVTAPIFVKMTESKLAPKCCSSGGWAATAVVLLGALLTAAGLLWAVSKADNKELLPKTVLWGAIGAAVFFVFLACISLPHIILMHLFYKKES